VASSIGHIPEQPQRQIHYDYKELKEYADDPDYLIKYAELGNRMAMYRLGRYYLENTDEIEDAEYWLEQAAKKVVRSLCIGYIRHTVTKGFIIRQAIK
jgi:TPR repeat protein